MPPTTLSATIKGKICLSSAEAIVLATCSLLLLSPSFQDSCVFDLPKRDAYGGLQTLCIARGEDVACVSHSPKKNIV